VDREAQQTRAPDDLVEEPGLADARLAGQEQQLARGCRGRGQPAAGERDEIVAAHQNRAGQWHTDAGISGHPRRSS
jgi:hypothetical protein